jgi:preprotein translocase subunit YajC
VDIGPVANDGAPWKRATTLINSVLLLALTVLAQENGAPPEGGAGGPPSWSPLILMTLILVVFYFTMILPTQRREKKQRELLYSSLKKNDKVLTQAGIIGIVLNMSDKDDEVTLKLDEGKMKVLRSSIIKIFDGSESAQEAGKKT